MGKGKMGSLFIIGALVAAVYFLFRAVKGEAAPVPGAHPYFKVGDTIIPIGATSGKMRITWYSPEPAVRYDSYNTIALDGPNVGWTTGFFVDQIDDYYKKV